MPTSFTDSNLRAGGFVVREANGYRSREMGVVLSGRTLVAGMVVGKVTASGKYVAWTAGASDGSQTVAGILWDATDASLGDVRQTIVVRDAEVNWGELQWDAGVTGGNKTTARGQMATLGLIARDSIPA
jgi:hypothetical protein